MSQVLATNSVVEQYRSVGTVFGLRLPPEWRIRHALQMGGNSPAPPRGGLGAIIWQPRFQGETCRSKAETANVVLAAGHARRCLAPSGW